jgi:hypothetical protein
MTATDDEQWYALNTPENWAAWDKCGELTPGWDGRFKVDGRQRWFFRFQFCLFDE